MLFVVVIALAAAAPASASTFRGTVVARSAGSLAVASRSGVVRIVHVSSRARVGSLVRVSGAHVAVVGRAHHALIRGVVVRRVGSTRFIAAGQALLAVRARRGLAALGADPAPVPGTIVQESVEIDDQGELDEQSSQTLGQAASTQVTATVTSVGAGTITLSVNGQPLTLPLPAGLTLATNIVGSTVTLTLNLGGGTATAEPDDEQGDDNDNQDEGGAGDD